MAWLGRVLVLVVASLVACSLVPRTAAASSVADAEAVRGQRTQAQARVFNRDMMNEAIERARTKQRQRTAATRPTHDHGFDSTPIANRDGEVFVPPGAAKPVVYVPPPAPAPPAPRPFVSRVSKPDTRCVMCEFLVQRVRAEILINGMGGGMPFGGFRPVGPFPFLRHGEGGPGHSGHSGHFMPNENAVGSGAFPFIGSAPQGRPVVGLPPDALAGQVANPPPGDGSMPPMMSSSSSFGGMGEAGMPPGSSQPILSSFSSSSSSSAVDGAQPPPPPTAFVELESTTSFPQLGQIWANVKNTVKDGFNKIKDQLFHKQQAQQQPPGTPVVPPPPPKPMPDPMRAEYIWKTKRERNTDMMVYKPTQTRFSNMYDGPFRNERRAQERYENNQMYAIVFQVIDDICTRRMPKPFYSFCGQAMEKYQFIARGLRWHDRPDAICMQMDMCGSQSYIQRGPHTTYRLN